MMALLSFILQIILQMVTKQKKTSAKRITGVENPSKRQIKKAYRLLIDDLILLKRNGYEPGKVARALYINLNPNKFAKNGIDWYEESQYELDRVLGNTTSHKELNFRKMTVNIREQMDYIQLYFKFPTNNFFYQPQQKYYMVASKEGTKYYLSLMLGKYCVKKINYKNKNDIISLLLRFYASLPKDNELKSFSLNLTNIILNERNYDLGGSVNKLGSYKLAGLFWQKLGSDYRNIWRWRNWVNGIRGDRGRTNRSEKEIIGLVENWYKIAKTGKYEGIWYQVVGDEKGYKKRMKK